MSYSKSIDLYDDGIGKVQYIDHMGNDKTIVNAARVSFGQDNELPVDDRDEKLIRYLIKNKHTSPFEHCSLTFKFTVPLFVRGQHHRHRTWSYNEISRRYTEENIQFFEPKTFRTQHDKNRQASNDDEIDPVTMCKDFFCGKDIPIKMSSMVVEHHRQCLNLYNRMLEQGICREQARGVLPQNIYTSYYGTVNLHNLIKFILLRDDEHAQKEIQVVARACKEIAKDLFPAAMRAFDELRV